MRPDNMTAEQVIEALGLVPLDQEGGLVLETFKSAVKTRDGQAAATAIFYLLRGDSFSHLHRLTGDELYHFYLGDPVELTELGADGEVKTTILGHDLMGGETVQHLVPAGSWQGSCLKAGGRWALLGTTMCPGYRQDMYEHADPGKLLAGYPRAREAILRLTGKVRY